MPHLLAPLILAIVPVGSTSVLVGQQGGPAVDETPTLTTEKVQDNVFVFHDTALDRRLRGSLRANCAVFVTGREAMLIDVRGGWGPALRTAIGRLSARPLTTIINTHAHPGHVNGNPEGFGSEVAIVAHTAAASRMATMPVFVANGGRGLPSRTFTDRLTLGEGRDRIELYYFGRGHTDGDIWVVFPAARTLYADMVPALELPVIDPESGGSAVALPATLERAVTTLGGVVDTVIPAHGSVLSFDDLRGYAAFNREFLDAVADGRRAGRSIDEIANAWKMPDRYAHYRMPTSQRIRENVAIAFEQLSLPSQ